MAVPNIFATKTGSIPLSELDTNFATPITVGTTSIALGDTAASISNVSLVNPTLGTPASGTLTNCTIPQLSASTGSTLVGTIQSGTGSVTRTVASKLNDVVSVKDFGAVGDGVADDTAAIQAAINSGYDGIYFPAGIYLVSSVINITSQNTRLFGDGRKVATIKSSSTSADVLHYYIAGGAPTKASYLYGTALKGLSIISSVTTSTGAAVRLTSVAAFLLDDVSITGFLKGVVIEGGQLNTFSNFDISASGYTGSTIANQGLFHLSGVTANDATYQTPFTCEVNDFHITGASKAYSCIYIEAIDQINFNNGYTGIGYQNVIQFLEQTHFYVAAVFFNNVYFEGGTALATVPIIVEMPAGTQVAEVSFSQCYFGHGYQGFVSNGGIGTLKIIGCNFANSEGYGIYISDTTLKLANISLIGNTFNGNANTTVSTSAIYINDVRRVLISGNRIVGASAAGCSGISLIGSIQIASVVGNLISNCTNDLITTATITTYTQGTNSSDVTAPVALGSTLGNVVNSNALILDWYEEITSVPTLTFGGAAVGITGNLNARYTRIGDRCFFSIYIGLTSKGSSTGVALIGNLPFTSIGAFSQACELRPTLMTAGVLDYGVYALVNNNSTTMRIDKGASTGSIVQLTDADFTNSSIIIFSGSYQCV